MTPGPSPVAKTAVVAAAVTPGRGIGPASHLTGRAARRPLPATRHEHEGWATGFNTATAWTNNHGFGGCSA